MQASCNDEQANCCPANRCPVGMLVLAAAEQDTLNLRQLLSGCLRGLKTV